MKRANSEKERLIDQIISEEYPMFSSVQNIGGRAACQDDPDTFYIMRYAQHSIFGRETLESYLEDIGKAKREGRNLIAEKYSRMMEETDPDWFEKNLRPYLPEPGRRSEILADSLTVVFMSCYERVKQQYPALLAVVRGPYDNRDGASIRLYFSSELKTWSEKTLLLACSDIADCLEAGKNPVLMLYETIIAQYRERESEEGKASSIGKGEFSRKS